MEVTGVCNSRDSLLFQVLSYFNKILPWLFCLKQLERVSLWLYAALCPPGSQSAKISGLEARLAVFNLCLTCELFPRINHTWCQVIKPKIDSL